MSEKRAKTVRKVSEMRLRYEFAFRANALAFSAILRVGNYYGAPRKDLKGGWTVITNAPEGVCQAAVMFLRTLYRDQFWPEVKGKAA